MGSINTIYSHEKLLSETNQVDPLFHKILVCMYVETEHDTDWMVEAKHEVDWLL